MRIFHLLISLLVMGAVSSCCKKPEKLTRQEVVDIINRFDDGWRHKDAKIVDSVLSKQYLYFTQSGHTFDRASLIQTAASSVYQLQTMERQQYTIQLEENTAVVNTVWKGKGSYHGQEFDDNQRCSITVIKTDGAVKILAEHCTPIKESL